MALARINHNAHLTDVHRILAVHGADTSRQIGMLSSGLRVGRSSDDPASLALADGISSEVRAIAEGTRNIQQTFSLIQVADGSLNEISAMVNRMRELAMQASSSVFNDVDRANIHAEFNGLRDEIDRIAATTTYNGRKLLTGANGVLDSTSTAVTDAATTGLTDIDVSDASLGTYTFVDSPDDDTLTLGDGAHTQTVSLRTFLEADGGIADDASHKVRFDSLGIEVTLAGQGVPGASGRYVDGALDGQSLVVEGRGQFTFQVGPSETSNDVSHLDVNDMRATGATLNLADVSIASIADAQAALTRVAHAAEAVSAERNRLGAFQNRLQLSIATSQSVIERMTSAESQIREVDVSKAASNMARSQILSSAATSIAVKADADIQRILTLLR